MAVLFKGGDVEKEVAFEKEVNEKDGNSALLNERINGFATEHAKRISYLLGIDAHYTVLSLAFTIFRAVYFTSLPV